jgi:hypothetical protein
LPKLETFGHRFNGKFGSYFGGRYDEVLHHECFDRLKGLPVWRLQICSVENCGVVFLKAKKALYCRDHRSLRSRAQRYREKLKGRFTAEELRDKRHEYYLTRVRRLKGEAKAAAVRKNINPSQLGREAVKAVEAAVAEQPGREER